MAEKRKRRWWWMAPVWVLGLIVAYVLSPVALWWLVYWGVMSEKSGVACINTINAPLYWAAEQSPVAQRAIETIAEPINRLMPDMVVEPDEPE